MIDRLEMFLALARERHFGRAAEACGVAQPSLSSAIRQLEDQLGVQLVIRGSRFQGLTPEGERVLERARAITADVRSLREEMRAVRHGLTGQLRIGVIPTALPRIADLTAPFLRRNPGIRVKIHSATSGEILGRLQDHSLDAGLSYLDHEPLGKVAAIPLFQERYVLLTTPDGPLERRSTAEWADLAGLPLCLLSSEMQNRRIINGHLADAGLSVEAAIESNSVLALIAHVATGHWHSVLPEALAAMVTGDPRLLALPLVAPAAQHRIGLITPARDLHTPALEALLAAARRLSPA